MAGIGSFVFIALTLMGYFLLQIMAFDTAELFKAAQADCLKKYPLTHDELILFNMFEHLDVDNPSKNLKCYTKCVSEHEGYIVNENINEAKVIKVIMDTIKVDEATAKQFIAKCNQYKQQSDLCEGAYYLIDCLHELKKA